MALSRASRFLTLLFAAVQFGLPAIAAVSDGETALSTRSAGMHVEDTAASDCTPPHSAHCAICRYLTTATRIGQPHVDITAIDLLSAITSADTGLLSSALGQLPRSRAPPTA